MPYLNAHFPILKKSFATIAMAGILSNGTAYSYDLSVESDDLSLNYSEIDFMTDTGVQRVYFELREIARDRCHNADERLQKDKIVSSAFCVEKTLDAFIELVGNARLTSFHKTLARDDMN